MKHTLQATSIVLAWLTTTASAEDINTLAIPNTCSAIQVWVDTILLCQNIWSVSNMFDFSQTWDAITHMQWGNVDLIVASNPQLRNNLDSNNSVSIDNNNDGEFETMFQLDFRNAPILSLTWEYGVLEDNTWDCYSYQQSNRDVLDCNISMETFRSPGYDCLNNMNSWGWISLDKGDPLFFHREAHSICTRENISES